MNKLHKLTKVSRPDVEGGLRTDTVLGSVVCFPKKGLTMQMVAEPLNPEADIRFIETSPVTDVQEKDGVTTFQTLTGSVYTLEQDK